MTDCIFDSTDPVLGVIAQELASSGHATTSTHAEPTNSGNSNGSSDSKSSTFVFRLESFLTRARPCQKLFPSHVQKQRYEKVTVQERLIMLSVAEEETSKKDHQNGKDGVLVAGMEVLEYTLYPHPSSATESSSTTASRKGAQSVERIVYVAKVDTSGYWPPPSVNGANGVDIKKVKSPTQSLVQGYLKAVRDGQLNKGDDNTRGRVVTSKTSLFVFARAQPQYLFANSADNEKKRVLDDRGLVRWWKNMLGSVFVSPLNATTSADTISSASSLKAYWFIPGVDSERQAMGVIRQQYPPQSLSTGGFTWTYGYPDKESTEKASTLIPQFPDDPKSRMMRSASCQNGNVDIRTFWELTAIGEESGAGKITGFFRVLMEAQDKEAAADQGTGTEAESTTSASTEAEAESTTSASTEAETESTAGTVPESVLVVSGSEGQYTKMFNFLLNLDFRTLEQARESTTRWTSQIQTWTRPPLVIDSSPAENERQEEGKEPDTSAVATVDTTLQQLYQRRLWIQVKALKVDLPLKGASTDSQSSTFQASSSGVQVLGAGLIKRKPATADPSSSGVATAPAVNVLGAGLIKRKSPTTTPSTVDSSAPPVNMLGASFIKKRKIDP
ncbi:regulator of Ty1 transposition protein 109 [Entomortierella parvispora]|uniref:histone acetyltransferase n=1 Tax=Entomortierella parvispora TaxID=205924 RepID=A0A9P3HJE0_9FUNG|nr:regulator of Ty1 transposition protein 109 [Entomortierella parvispora]